MLAEVELKTWKIKFYGCQPLNEMVCFLSYTNSRTERKRFRHGKPHVQPRTTLQTGLRSGNDAQQPGRSGGRKVSVCTSTWLFPTPSPDKLRAKVSRRHSFQVGTPAAVKRRKASSVKKGVDRRGRFSSVCSQACPEALTNLTQERGRRPISHEDLFGVVGCKAGYLAKRASLIPVRGYWSCLTKSPVDSPPQVKQLMLGCFAWSVSVYVNRWFGHGLTWGKSQGWGNRLVFQSGQCCCNNTRHMFL